MKTSAMELLEIVWEKGSKDSWGRINHSMHSALTLAIGSGLEFCPGVFEACQGKFRWSYWASDLEWVYSSAIQYGNDTATASFEAFVGRDPFRANEVELGYLREGFIHASTATRQRERLAVGFSFPFEGARWFVTRFDDSKSILRAARYEHNHQTGKPKQLRVFGHDEMRELFKSARKQKQDNESR